MRLLLVEDDRMIGDSLRAALRLEGHAVDWVRDAAAADGTLAQRALRPRAARPRPAAGRRGARRADGLDVLRALRARGDATPVIVLTARDARGDRVAGLDAGADDYLVKPFELDELNARMRAVLRRHAGRAEPVLRARRRDARPGARAQVTRDGAPVLLSAREFAVLEALMARPGAVLSRAQLEDRLYGWGEEIESNAVSVYIHQLRRKLGADFIRNVRGVGYFVGAGATPTGDDVDPRPPAACSLLGAAGAGRGWRWAASPTATCCAETEALFDYQLRQMALSLRDQGEIAPDAGRRRWPTSSSTSWCRSGPSTAAASTPRARTPTLPARALLGLADAAASTGAAWRTFSVATPRARDPGGAAASQIRAAAGRQCGAAQRAAAAADGAAAGAGVWWLAARYAGAAARASPPRCARATRDSLAPLPTAGLPDEVAPLVARAERAARAAGRSARRAARVRRRRGARAALAAHGAASCSCELLRRAGDAGDARGGVAAWPPASTAPRAWSSSC